MGQTSPQAAQRKLGCTKNDPQFKKVEADFNKWKFNLSGMNAIVHSGYHNSEQNDESCYITDLLTADLDFLYSRNLLQFSFIDIIAHFL